MRIVEFRSDTKTKPSAAMRRAMFEAEVGDDVSAEDPTVNRLEQLAAEKLGKESGLFVASGTMGNLICLLTQCARGQEALMGDLAHIFWAEAAGAAAFGGISYHTIRNQPDGTLLLEDIRDAIRPLNIHFPETALLCVENTHNRCGGAVLSLEYMASIRELADAHGIPVHLDGARIFNAAAFLGVPASDIAEFFDTVQFCVSKGLGAPVGSLVVGTHDFIERARKTRKMLGGGMRQAGVIAAAGIVSLGEGVERLPQDHENARILAEGLSAMPGLEINLASVQSNIVNVDLAREDYTAPALEAALAARGVLCGALNSSSLRLVTHVDVNVDDVSYALEVFRDLLGESSN